MKYDLDQMFGEENNPKCPKCGNMVFQQVKLESEWEQFGVDINEVDGLGIFFCQSCAVLYENKNGCTDTGHAPFVFKEIKIKAEKSPTKEGCFVATAVFGNYNNYYVFKLRAFRDMFLINYKFGKYFIDKYYKFGPFLAKHIIKSKTSGNLIKLGLMLFVTVINKMQCMKESDYKI